MESKLSGERLKKLRKELGLTQKEFAERLGMKQNTFAQYEIGRNKPIDAVMALICKEFNANEEWLRYGKGNMFIELNREDELMLWAGKILASETSDFRKRFVRLLASLSDQEWELLEKRINDLIQNRDIK